MCHAARGVAFPMGDAVGIVGRIGAACAVVVLVGCAQVPATSWSQVEANCVAQQGAPDVCRCFVDNLSKNVSLDRYQYLVERGLKERNASENDWLTLSQAERSNDEFTRITALSMKPCAYLLKGYGKK